MQLIGILLLLLLGIGLIAGLIITGMRNREEVDPLQARLAELGERDDEMPTSLEELEMSLSQRDRILMPMFEALSGFVTQFTPEQQIETIRKKLERANKPDTDPAVFFVQRILLMVLFGGGAFALFLMVAEWPISRVFIGTILGSLLGFYLPVLQINSEIKRRQDGIIRDLPDALDLLTICVEAGLGFDTAMGKVYEKWDNDLSNAFGRVLQEIQLGKLRREALRDMSDRLDVPDFTTFAAAIIQADQLGVSIGKILRVQSDQMRVKRRQRAQEKAQQAPVKMMIPLVFLIFPAIWIVLMGPALVLILESGAF
ncbi:MAG: type II secretion system F family protein [Chloroflexi bacterium]|nr:type II secretion system F family protein [Chloroflexota bacterium]